MSASVKFNSPLSFSANINSKKDLPEIMYKIFTSHPFSQLKNNKRIFVNFNQVNLKDCLAIKKFKITFIFEVYQNKEKEIWGKVYSLDSLYDDIQCTKVPGYPNIKVNPCSIGRSKYKLFFSKAQDLADYIHKLNKKIVSRKDHNKIFNIISKWEHFKNHNKDVPLLHFK